MGVESKQSVPKCADKLGFTPQRVVFWEGTTPHPLRLYAAEEHEGDDLKTPGDGSTRCEIEEVQANEGCSNGVLRGGSGEGIGPRLSICKVGETNLELRSS